MKILCLFFTALITLALFSQSKISEPISSPKIIEEYAASIQEDDNEAALKALEKVLVGDTSYLPIQVQKSLILIKLERYEEAIKVCKEAIALPRNSSTQTFKLNLGYALDMLDRKDEALKVYQDLLVDYPFFISASNNIASIQLESKQYYEAFETYKAMARMFPFDGRGHFNLGVFAYNEGHFTEAFMALNICILIEPYSDRAFKSLQFLNEISNNSKAEKNPKDGFKLDSDEYSEIDLLIKNYVALSKKYKVPGKSELYLAKQNHLLLDQLSKKKNTDYFYSEFYEPIFDKIAKEGWFEQMQLLELIPSTNETHKNIVQKGMKDIKAFNNWFQDEWYSMNKFHEVNYRNLKGKHQVWYFNDGTVKSIGNLNPAGTEYIGDFCFFHENGELSSEGVYKEKGLDGLWNYYYNTGNKQREITYNEGEVVGTVKLFDENGALDQEFGFKDGNREGFFKQYYRHGGLYREGANKKNNFEGPLTYYFKNGEKMYETTYSEGKLTGLLIEYYSNGKVFRKEEFEEGFSNGKYNLYWIKGNERVVANKVQGEFNGAYKVYHANGQLATEGSYEKGKRNGTWKEYYENGNLSETKEYSNNELQGLVKLFDYDGKIYSEKGFRNGYMISYKFYNKEGEVLSEAESKKKQYTLENYHPNGTIESRGDYKANVGYVGDWESFDEYGNTLYKYAYEDGHLQGKTEKYYPTGELEIVKHYDNGFLDGEFTSYFQHGQINQNGYYKKGESIGVWESYYENGAIEWRRNYYNEELVGDKTEYDVAGKLDYIEHFDLNVLVGATYYDTLGRELSSFDFKNGEGVYKKQFLNKQVGYTGRFILNSKEGKFQWFYPNGQLQSEGNYVNNKKQGTWVGYHQNGKIEYKGEYLNGSKDGMWEFFHDNEQVSDSTPYLYGEIHGLDKSFNKNGSFQDQTMYAFGLRHGEMKFYDDNGVFQMSRIYNQGEIIAYYYLDVNGNKKEFDVINGTAKVRSLFKNGKPAREFNLVKGNFEGEYKSYYENGQIELDYSLVSDERHGIYSSYYENGQLKMERNYKHGVLDGIERVYFENGKLKEKSVFVNGRKHGSCTIYEIDGSIKKELIYRDGVGYEI